MDTPRYELNRRRLTIALALTSALALLVLFLAPTPPGAPLGQSAAIAGALLCLLPALYAVVKRGGLTAHPPRWFTLHVLGVLVGVVFIALHVAGGDWLTPPGVVFALLVILVVQGAYAYFRLAGAFAGIFARSGRGFINDSRQVDAESRQRIRTVIDAKRRLLSALDAEADEAVFSPNLIHWLRHPLLSTRYQRLADSEARLVGARRQAGLLLSIWRRVHMLFALVFVLGLVTHVVLVLFFAGYVAADRDIDWWHIAAWGGR